MQNTNSSGRIAFIIGSMGKGGAERVISILANKYADKGWKVDILMLLEDRCDYKLNIDINLVPIINKNRSSITQLPKWLYEVRKYVINYKPDRIVSFVARINLITLISCIGLKQKVVISERNDPKADGRSIYVKYATFLLYPYSNEIIFQTKWAQSCFPAKIQKKSVIIPNPIRVDTLSTQQKQEKIVSVGRLSEQKNHSLLLDAFYLVQKCYPNYTLYIYGEGKLRNKLSEKIKNLHLTDKVFLPGTVSNIHETISDADMFVLSSSYEGLSNALLEAMMMGIPCISTDCAGSNEAIIDGENGLLVPVGNTEKLACAIKKLINNKDLATKLGNNARVSSKSYCSENIIKKWQAVIEREAK